jgi:hypothetical protein
MRLTPSNSRKPSGKPHREFLEAHLHFIAHLAKLAREERKESGRGANEGNPTGNFLKRNARRMWAEITKEKGGKVRYKPDSHEEASARQAVRPSLSNPARWSIAGAPRT